MSMNGLALGLLLSGSFLIVFTVVTEWVNISVYGRLIGKRYLEAHYTELNTEGIGYGSSGELRYFSQNIIFIEPRVTLFGDYVIYETPFDGTHSGIVIRGSELHHLIERRVFEGKIPTVMYGKFTEVEPI